MKRADDSSIYSDAGRAFLGVLQYGLLNDPALRNLHVSCDEREPGVIEIRHISTRLGVLRGIGRGTVALRRLCGMADDDGVALYVQPHSDDSATAARLRAWYLREGFTVDAGDGRLIRPCAPRPCPAP